MTHPIDASMKINLIIGVSCMVTWISYPSGRTMRFQACSACTADLAVYTSTHLLAHDGYLLEPF
jgi:hypothetical protein